MYRPFIDLCARLTPKFVRKAPREAPLKALRLHADTELVTTLRPANLLTTLCNIDILGCVCHRI